MIHLGGGMLFLDKLTEIIEDMRGNLLEDSPQGRFRRGIMTGPIGLIAEREVKKRRENKIRQEGYSQGELDVKAEYAVKFQALELRLHNAFQLLKGSEQYFKLIITMNAVAISAAGCDGWVSQDDRNKIDLFISGVSGDDLPVHIKNKINELYNNPLNIREAMVMAKESGVNIDAYDEIIEMVVYADGPANVKEHAFIQAWSELKVA